MNVSTLFRLSAPFPTMLSPPRKKQLGPLIPSPPLVLLSLFTYAYFAPPLPLGELKLDYPVSGLRGVVLPAHLLFFPTSHLNRERPPPSSLHFFFFLCIPPLDRSVNEFFVRILLRRIASKTGTLLASPAHLRLQKIPPFQSPSVFHTMITIFGLPTSNSPSQPKTPRIPPIADTSPQYPSSPPPFSSSSQLKTNPPPHFPHVPYPVIEVKVSLECLPISGVKSLRASLPN